MSWQHLIRTLAIAVLGAAALLLASQARAEGGDQGAIVSPDQAEEFMKAATEAKADAAKEEVAEAPGPRKPLKAAKGADRKAREAAASADKPKDGIAAKAAASRDDQDAGEQTASLPASLTGLVAGLRRSDAARAVALKPLIARYATENEVPYELADAVIRLESRYNASARKGVNMGLTQINFHTAQSLGYQGAAVGLLDAETNLRYGLKYLAKAYKISGGDVCGALLRFQFGYRTQTMTSASRAYCAKVKVITAAAE